MAELQAYEQFRCRLCNVSSDTRRQYLRHFTTKRHADIQKRTDAMELEVPAEFASSVHTAQPRVQGPQHVLQANIPASIVPESSVTNVEDMECVSSRSPVPSLHEFSEDFASSLSEDDPEDDGE